MKKKMGIGHASVTLDMAWFQELCSRFSLVRILTCHLADEVTDGMDVTGWVHMVPPNSDPKVPVTELTAPTSAHKGKISAWKRGHVLTLSSHCG